MIAQPPLSPFGRQLFWCDRAHEWDFPFFSVSISLENVGSANLAKLLGAMQMWSCGLALNKFSSRRKYDRRPSKSSESHLLNSRRFRFYNHLFLSFCLINVLVNVCSPLSGGLWFPISTRHSVAWDLFIVIHAKIDDKWECSLRCTVCI